MRCRGSVDGQHGRSRQPSSRVHDVAVLYYLCPSLLACFHPHPHPPSPPIVTYPLLSLARSLAFSPPSISLGARASCIHPPALPVPSHPILARPRQRLFSASPAAAAARSFPLVPHVPHVQSPARLSALNQFLRDAAAVACWNHHTIAAQYSAAQHPSSLRFLPLHPLAALWSPS